jgi:hypothetical protein
VGQFGSGVVPVGALKTAGGYEIAWNLGNGIYVVWNTDANGNYAGNATGVVSGASYTLESQEATFGEDLNGDGKIGPAITTIATNGTTTLVQTANEYELNPSGGTGPLVQYQNTPVLVGQFGSGIIPVGALKTAGGYEIAWNLGNGTYVVWNTDANGNYAGNATGVVAGSSYTLESQETTFGEDLNGDGKIGPVLTTLATNGTTTLVQTANQYELNPSGGGSGPFVQYQNTPVLVGQFGAGIVPVGALKTAGGYEIAWNLGNGAYVVWNTDANGNYAGNATGVVAGTSYTLESQETTFGEDLNGDGTIGLRISTLAANGTTMLVQEVNEYELNPNGGGSGPFLTFSGSAVTVGQFGSGVVPVGALKTAGGYEVAWNLGNGTYVVWNTDANGNYAGNATGVVSGTSYAFESLETTFGEDLNGDGTIGVARTTIATNATTALVQIANEYELNPSGGGAGPFLTLSGNLIAAGQFGAGVVPVGAVGGLGGYYVAWSLGGDEYVIWNTDGNGNYLGNTSGVVSGQNFAFEDLEPYFGEDLNGDGRLPTRLIVNGPTVNLSGQSQSVIIDLPSYNASVSFGLSQPSLTFIGTPEVVTLGTGAAIVEYGLQPTGGIEEVAGFVLGTDELNIDLIGAPNSTLVAYDTKVNGTAAIALASTNDPLHGIVLTNVTGGLTAAHLLTSQTTFVGGHALIS